MTADARQVERLRETAERRLHADRPPYTRLVPVGAHVLIELLDAAEAHAALVKAVEGVLEDYRGAHDAVQRSSVGSRDNWWDRLDAILAATDTAADRGAR